MSRLTALAIVAFLSVGSVRSLAGEPKNLAKPAKDLASWRLEQHEGAKADIAAADDGIVVTVKETTGTDWHVQVVQASLDLVEGKEYTLTFKAKASPDRSVPVNAMIDQEDWHQIGLAETAELTGDWKDFKYEFKAEGVAKEKNRISFILGGDKGKIWIKDLVLAAK